MFYLVCYMKKSTWESVNKTITIFGGNPKCFDKVKPKDWTESKCGEYRYVIDKKEDYEFKNKHMYGDFFLCKKCKHYYSGEQRNLPKSCLICGGNEINKVLEEL